MKAMKVGFVGVGDISGIYLENICNVFKSIEVIGVCDLIREKAEKAAEKYAIPKIYNDMYELFADPEVDIVLNITRPYEHYDVTKAALTAGKHVYTEKPLAPVYSEAKELYDLAAEKGVYLGGAPDTFLGAGIQTCRKLIDDGFIGTPVGAAANFITPGPDDWHPAPDNVYQYGGGPMLDMGPYYITAMLNMLGRVKSVTGMAKITFAERMIKSQPRFGEMMKVSVPTYTAGIMEFESGVIGTLLTTFDVHQENAVCSLEIYGTDGAIYVPDPNFFGTDGPNEIRLFRKGSKKTETMPLLHSYSKNSRALGLAEMADAIQSGRPHRANSMQLLHAVEIMTSIEKSSESGKRVDMVSPFEQQPPLPLNYFI